MISSFIRYIGGKSKALDVILSNIPSDIEEYREPMIGSGIVLLGLLQTRRRPSKISIGDIDYDIYNLWKQVINNPDELISECIELRKELKDTKDLQNLSSFGVDGPKAAAVSLVLNICTKFGNYGGLLDINECKSRLSKLEETLKYKLYGASNLIGNANIYNEDYEWALMNGGANVLIFLDPPYYNVTESDGYYINHTNFDFDRLTQLLVSTKHKFLMTLDISKYSDSLKKHFNTQVYNIFYNMPRIWKQEILIKNF